MSFAEADEVISLIDLLFGSSDEVDLRRGPESPLVLADPATFMRLMLNCKLTDRVMFTVFLLAKPWYSRGSANV